MDILKIQDQIGSNRRSVAFDSYDITVRQMYDMLLDGMIDIAPEYQRHFKWDPDRQSALIESLLLGIPIPSLFMATNPDSSWEVVDGLQRLTSIVNFVGDPEQLKKVGAQFKQLKLSGLEKLDSMNGVAFGDLPKSLQFMLQTRPLRVTVLNDRSDFAVRYDLFERLNTGGIRLHEQEIRNCIFIGEFNEFIKELSQDQAFRSVVKMTENAERSGSYEELVLRFFAYFEDRDYFVHSVTGFLNKYMENKTKTFKNKSHLKKIFTESFAAMKKALPDGIVRGSRKNITPVVLYEAIAVGTAVAIADGRKIHAKVLQSLLDDKELKKLTTGATNNKKMVLDRIEFVSGKF
jgi:uncharacterized protein with ParB-like and HNH nuclease domain